jgi:hypothetical protein
MGGCVHKKKKNKANKSTKTQDMKFRNLMKKVGDAIPNQIWDLPHVEGEEHSAQGR